MRNSGADPNEFVRLFRSDLYGQPYGDFFTHEDLWGRSLAV